MNLSYMVVRRDVTEGLTARLLIALVSDGMTTMEQVTGRDAYLIVASGRDGHALVREWAGFGVEAYTLEASRDAAIRWIEHAS